MKKAFVTVTGDDKVGIIASVAVKLASYNTNILDITQTVMKDDVFVMIALVDMEAANVPFHEMKEGLPSWARRWACPSASSGRIFSARCTRSDPGREEGKQ